MVNQRNEQPPSAAWSNLASTCSYCYPGAISGCVICADSYQIASDGPLIATLAARELDGLLRVTESIHFKMGASCSCGRTDPVSGLVCHCMLSPDIISCILAQLPLDHWEVARELHSTWAKAVRCKARESTHARLLGWHPGLSEGTFTW